MSSNLLHLCNIEDRAPHRASYQPPSQALEQEVETQRNMIRHLEKKRGMLELEMQEKIARTKLVYEERMKGKVLPPC